MSEAIKRLTEIYKKTTKIEFPETVYKSFAHCKPIYTDYGQFCGNIETEVYERNYTVFEFVLYDGKIFEATQYPTSVSRFHNDKNL